MTEREINLAIAEAFGLKAVEEKSGLWSLRWPSGSYAMYNGGIDANHAWNVGCPNFCSDLDAVHLVEWMLNRYQRSVFSQHLGSMFPRDEDGDSTGWEGRFQRAIHATARHRAEAVLRTLGLWPEEVDQEKL